MAPTERQNPRSRGLDRKTTLEILRTLNREDARVPAAVRRVLPAIASAVDHIVSALNRGGRLFYVGSGTSGRLGALDAAECPPTFGVSPRLVQAVVAGGHRALWQAVEGIEDSAALGTRDLKARHITSRDVVVGISASGTTPYVLGALTLARRRGAFTIGVTANPRSRISRVGRIVIAPKTGPEAIAGSTRMKAGTAQKLVLNLLSTTAMVRLGHVFDNWMINVAMSNRKLLRRSLRILEETTGANLSSAKHALRQSGHDLRVALILLKTNASPREAKLRLAAAGGDVRRALKSTGERAGGLRPLKR